jgi:hypothetical protein
MDNKRLLERIEDGNLKFEEEVDDLMVQIDLEAADSLGMLLKSIRVESGRRPTNVEAALNKQSKAVVERLNFLDELRVLEIDGIAQAVQIRSTKPSPDGFIEVMLRGGTSISVERKGSALHISKKDFEQLSSTLLNIQASQTRA